jgi:hypothetical protein
MMQNNIDLNKIKARIMLRATLLALIIVDITIYCILLLIKFTL